MGDMARCPFAIWRPIPENAFQSHITPTQVILHSAVDAPGETSLYAFFARADQRLESHFFIQLDGDIEQYMDTQVRADANLDANVRAISIETEDDGNPDQRPWSAAQKASVERLLDWIFKTHPQVLPRVCPAWDRPGVGYHTMWGAPSHWTPVQKTCPGAVRISQFKSWLVPWINAWGAPELPEEVDMVIVFKTTDRSPRAIVGSKLLGFKPGEYEKFKASLDKAGVPVAVWECSVEQYDQTSDTFRYSQAQVVA